LRRVERQPLGRQPAPPSPARLEALLERFAGLCAQTKPSLGVKSDRGRAVTEVGAA